MPNPKLIRQDVVTARTATGSAHRTVMSLRAGGDISSPLRDALPTYFANDSFECQIGLLPTLTPVKVELVNGTSNPMIYDHAAILIHLEKQVFDYDTQTIIPKKKMLDPYRQEVKFTIDKDTNRPKIAFEEIVVPAPIKRFTVVASKPITCKADITREDQAVVREFIKVYLSLGFDPNNVLIDGCCLLYIACRFDLPDSVRLLLNHGADPNQVQHFGIADAFQRTPLYTAAALNFADVITVLLSHESNCADPNLAPPAHDLGGATPAYAAVSGNNLEATCALVSGNADFNIFESIHMITPIYYAVYSYKLEQVYAILMSDTVNVDILQGGKTDHAGKSALFTALTRYFAADSSTKAEAALNIVSALVTKGADVNLVQLGSGKFAGLTPITYAESKGLEGQAILEILQATKLRCSAK